MNWSSPLVWAPAAAVCALQAGVALAFLLILTGFANRPGKIVITPGQLPPTPPDGSGWSGVYVILSVAFLIGATIYLMRRWAATCATVWLGEKGLIFRIQDRGKPRFSRVRFGDVRHFGFSRQGRNSRITTLAARHDSKRHRRFEVPVPERFFEDYCEQLQVHVEQRAPGALWSTHDADGFRYSRDWTMAELMDGPAIREMLARPSPRQRNVMICESEHGNMLLQTVHRELRMESTGHWLLEFRGKSSIRNGDGLVLGRRVQNQGNEHPRMELGTGENFELDLQSEKVRAGENEIGRFVWEGGEVLLTFTQPQAPLTGSLLLLWLTSLPKPKRQETLDGLSGAG